MPSHLPIDETPLQVLPALAKAIGLKEAIVLQQIHHSLNPLFNKSIFDGSCYWVRKTYEQWGVYFPYWSKGTISQIIRNLEKRGLLTSHKLKHWGNIKIYTINYNALNKVMCANPVAPLADSKSYSKDKESGCINEATANPRLLARDDPGVDPRGASQQPPKQAIRSGKVMATPQPALALSTSSKLSAEL